MARPKKALLSREIIGNEAITLVEEGNDLQLVPLAKRLGVSVSSLYHHVDGRDGVIHAMRQVLLSKYLEEGPVGRSWRELVRWEVERTWRMYAEHPRVLHYMLTVVIDEPDVLRFYTSLMTVFADLGIPDSEIMTTIEVIDAFSFGAALDALSPDEFLDPSAADPKLVELLRDHPVGAARNRRVFDTGLDLLLDGIEARVARAADAANVRGAGSAGGAGEGGG